MAREMLRTWLAAMAFLVTLWAVTATAQPTPVIGSERIGWDQAASDVSVLRFAAWVDALPSADLADVQCVVASPGAYTCSAAFPALTPGAHDIRLTAYEMVGDQRLESPPSEPLTVRLVVVPDPPGRPRVER